MAPTLSHSWRSWKNAKAVAALAVIALATGIACATSIFTVVNAVMLKPLPYAHADRWVALFGGSTLGGETDQISGLSVSDLDDYQQRSHSFDVFGWYVLAANFNLSSPGHVEHIEGAEVTPSLLDNVGINPVLGRLFQDSDGAHVALISRGLWGRLGFDPAIVGKSITLNDRLYTVLGVMPAWFQLPIVGVAASPDLHNDVWIPVEPPANESARRTVALYAGYARLKPGVTVSQARADVKNVAAEILKENPDRGASYTATLFGLQDFIARDIRPYLLLFIAAAVLLLLVTCANVAGLLVARSVSRAHEIAVRVAVGARRSDLALQFFLEGLLISIAAAVLGLLASIGLTCLVLSFAAQYTPRAAEVSVNGVVVLFVAGLACLTAILPALVPLWQAVRTPPSDVLSSGVRASASARSRGLSRSLVVAEIALAFLLLSIGGLLISELQILRHTPPGFDATHLLTFQLNASDEKYSSKEFVVHQDALLNSLQTLPGVSGAAFVNQLPLDGCCLITTFHPEDQPPNPSLGQDVSFLIVSPGYFTTMRIPLQKGRLLSAADTNENVVPIVIDESAERRYWPSQDPIGSFARVGDLASARTQVVGVVGDVRNEGLGEVTRPEIYFPNAVQPLREMDFVVRSSLSAASLVPAIRSALHAVDPDRSIYSVRSEDEIVSSSVEPQRLSSVVISFFALASFLMAALGIYGLMSYSVGERTVEIGTRMALGALPRDLLNMLLGDGLKMALYGVAIGIPVATSATWLVTRYFHLHHINALPYAASAALVGSVAIAASLFPAWRTSLLSPMVAIRNESESVWTAAWRSLERQPGSRGSNNQASRLDPSVVAAFADASRRADSFPQALAIALADLRQQLRAQSVMLFENVDASDSRYHFRAASPDVPVAAAIPAEGFLLGRLRFHATPLSFVPDEMDTVLRWSRDQKPQYIDEIEYLKKIGMRLAVPLRTKRKIIGLLLLGPGLDGNPYSLADKDLIQICAQQLSLMIENARLTDRVVEQEKIRRDVALAAEVQERLLPEKSIEDRAISIAAFTLPARGVGGDCHDFLELGDAIGIALADVSGKGIAAALIMAAIQASLRLIASESVSPAELASKMNSFLYRSTGFDRYATFFYAQVDAERQRLRYVNAGHNPPFLIRGSQSPDDEHSKASIEELNIGGTVIGMFPSADYEQAQVDLCPGDVILAFTDGVTEALNPSQEEFGEVRLKALLRQVSDLPINEIISRISQELRSWIAEAPQHDDMTFIVAKMN
jgi:predicted permease